MGASEPKRRTFNLRSNRVTTVTGFAPGDSLKTEWDAIRREWRLAIYSANGIRIDHSRLTLPGAAA